jgi:redox-sensitive bicupin YhaK (pirin superfamily)
MNTDMRTGMGSPALELEIAARSRELIGGLRVRRVLPYSQRRMVGPFIFLDQLGPTTFEGESVSAQFVDVPPHPHIGLATVTYLFEGELLHRDSLGTVQPIRPGEVNWMTAGRGVVHSERTPPELRRMKSRLHGVQSWVVLSQQDEECDPTFAHFSIGELPVVEGEGVRTRLIAGALYGARSPVPARSEMFYADALIEEGARLSIPSDYEERAVYLVEGAVTVLSDGENEGGVFEEGRLLVFKRGAPVTLTATRPARAMLLGGAKMDGARHIWWNFVSSSKVRIERAKADWAAGRFPPVPGETEFVPLPEG